VLAIRFAMGTSHHRLSLDYDASTCKDGFLPRYGVELPATSLHHGGCRPCSDAVWV
jgi:hypothetical protein